MIHAHFKNSSKVAPVAMAVALALVLQTRVSLGQWPDDPSQYVPLNSKPRSNAVEHTQKWDVVAGEQIPVFGTMKLDASCKPLEPSPLELLVPPQHGHACYKAETFPAAADFFNPASKCLGKEYPGFRVYYRSNASFQGLDSFEYRVDLGWPRTLKVRIEAAVKASPSNDTTQPMLRALFNRSPEQCLCARPWCRPSRIERVT